MMPPKYQKNCRQSISTDRLSNLPGDVTDNILVCLPLKDAVRTSILSKKWRYKWCTLPELDLTSLRLMEDSIPLTIKFPNIINHLLTLHSGPITKFIIYFGPFMIPYPYTIVDNLINFLSRNGIQHLVLGIFSGHDTYKLPFSVFTCLQLRHLTLENCLIELLPPDFKGFDRLISLELRSVKISSKLLESLISNCYLVEQLVLDVYGISDVFEVKAPMLKSFDFSGSLRYLWLKHVPRLAKISLNDRGSSAEAGKCDIAKFFVSFSVLEHLQLNNETLKFFAAGSGGVQTTLNSVKSLSLSNIYLDELDAVSPALCLIKSCPYLQYMEIEVGHDWYYDDDDDDDDDDSILAVKFLAMEGFSDVTFSHLREVKLGGNIATKLGIRLIKLLLVKSPVLVRMSINPYISEYDNWQFNDTLRRAEEMEVVVEEYLRESPKKAEVVYNIEYDPDCHLRLAL